MKIGQRQSLFLALNKKMIKKRIFIFLAVIIGVAIGAFYLSKFASGYRPDFSTKSLKPTGLLVATSYPNQATVYINGKANKNKTATTMSLAPSPRAFLMSCM